MVQQRIVAPNFPNTDALLYEELAKRPPSAVDILLVNPPAPDGGIWIRSQHRVGRRSREGMIWPQVDLAQMAALFPDFRVEVVDAMSERMSWAAFERLLDEKRPRYYVTQVTAPTLQNDMFGAFLARARGAVTLAFGTHVTPMPASTLKAYPALDYVLLGEPELTLRELVDVSERMQNGAAAQGDCSSEDDAWWPAVEPDFALRLKRLFTTHDPDWKPLWRDCAFPGWRHAARQDQGPRLAQRIRGGHQPAAPLYRQPRRSAAAAPRSVAAQGLSRAVGRRAVCVHRPQPRLSGSVPFLYQARLLRRVGAVSLAGERGG